MPGWKRGSVYLPRYAIGTAKLLADVTFDLAVRTLDFSSLIPSGVAWALFGAAIYASGGNSFVLYESMPTGVTAGITEQTLGTWDLRFINGAAPGFEWQINESRWVPCNERRTFSYYGTVGAYTYFQLMVLGWEYDRVRD